VFLFCSVCSCFAASSFIPALFIISWRYDTTSRHAIE
jgi:hypothetical protein